MRGEIYKNKIKNEARILRVSGKTYKEITDKLGIPKSTLSTWFGKQIKGPFDRKAQLAHLERIRPLALEAKRKDKEKQLRILKEKIDKEIKTFPLNDIGLYKSMLAMLYWAEGSKHEKVGGLKFANTDPRLLQLYMALLRKCYNINEERFRLRLHLHYYHRIKPTKRFWSEMLQIPLSQFNSTYIKKRSRRKRFRKNFMGICFVYYFSGDIRKDLMELAYKLQSITTKE